MRPNIINVLEENIGGKLFDIGLSNIFYYVSRGMGNKNKNKQMGLKHTKKLLQNKGNYQQNRKAA